MIYHMLIKIYHVRADNIDSCTDDITTLSSPFVPYSTSINVLTRMSTRVTKPPGWLKDFIFNIQTIFEAVVGTNS